MPIKNIFDVIKKPTGEALTNADVAAGLNEELARINQAPLGAVGNEEWFTRHPEYADTPQAHLGKKMIEAAQATESTPQTQHLVDPTPHKE